MDTMQMTDKEIQEFLFKHEEWLKDRTKGERAALTSCSSELKEKNLEGVNLEKAILIDVNMEETNLKRANLRLAAMYHSELREIILTEANLQGASLRSSNLKMAQMGRSILNHADLGSSKMVSANLSFADLRNTDLTDTKLKNAFLEGADLRGADLKGSDLRRAELKGADLRGADIDFASFTLSCRSFLNFKIDERQAKQLMYHVINLMQHSDIDTKRFIKKETFKWLETSHMVTKHKQKKLRDYYIGKF